MGKISWKPGNMVYPLPAVMVSLADGEGKSNIITVAWTGTVNTNPPMAYISVRPERYSYSILKETKEFVINLTTKDLIRATDYCGVKSGRDVDKFKEMNLHAGASKEISAPLIEESPVNIECRVRQMIPLGSHTMFLADVVHVNVSEEYMDETGRFDLAKAEPIVYSHGTYYDLGEKLGTFGYSIRKTANLKLEKSGKSVKFRDTSHGNKPVKAVSQHAGTESESSIMKMNRNADENKMTNSNKKTNNNKNNKSKKMGKTGQLRRNSKNHGK